MVARALSGCCTGDTRALTPVMLVAGTLFLSLGSPQALALRNMHTPAHGPGSTAGTRPPYIHVNHLGSPSPRKREMEFNEKVGQTVVIRCRAWPEKRADPRLHLCDQTHLSLHFPRLFPPQIPLISPFLTFDSSPKHPIISPVQFQNALPLHPIKCPYPFRQ